MSAAENVVALPGFSVPRSQAEPVPEIVDMCEELLSLARTGALRGLGVAKVTADPQLVTSVDMFSGPSPDRYCLVSAVQQLSAQTAKCMGWIDE